MMKGSKSLLLFGDFGVKVKISWFRNFLVIQINFRFLIDLPKFIVT